MVDDRDIIINQGRPRRPLRWRAWAFVLLLVGLPLAAAAGVLAWLLGRALLAALAPYGWLLSALLAALVVVAGLALTRALLAGGRYVAALASKAALVPLQNDQPIDVRDVRWLTRDTAAAMLERHYDVRQAEAERSGFGELTHLQQTVNPPAILPPAPVLALPGPVEGAPGGVPGLREALTSGLSSPEQWYIGAGADGTPATFGWNHTGFVGLAGVQGTGKSNTAALWAAQIAAAGGYLFVCDPQAGDEESLANRLAPLQPAIERLAVTPEEIAKTIALVDKIYQQRNSGAAADVPIALVFDEFLEHLVRGRLSADSMAQLQAMSAGGRKKRVHGLIISQVWSGNLVGKHGTNARQLLTHTLVHRCSQESATLMLPGAAYARQVGIAQTGQLMAYGTSGEPQLVTAPLVRTPDMAAVVAGRPSRPRSGRVMPVPSPAAAAAPPAPAPVAPTTPLAPLTLDEQIVLLLTDRPWLTSTEIAQTLGAEIGSVRTRLTPLERSAKITRRRTGRPVAEKYEYAVNQSINQRLTPAA